MTPKPPMIRLDQLTKRFPGQSRTAVDELTIDVPTGEIVVLVGPSGCGKTTTMRMINRLVEPSSGRIFLDGEDVTEVDADRLRRRIGYVIQQVGLFPHLTIHDNIATVPKLLGWDRRRVVNRVDELLELVGMDPATYGDRYPGQLSGGQRQRVGVARALGADPDVMLMDEPFGALDPITREHLQNEFLRIQEEMKKTIVFVTHDIDEAIKMGDRIAILREQSHVAQYDRPEHLLVNPADDFVSDFVGRGASLKRLSLSRVSDIALSGWPVVSAGADAAEARQAMIRTDRSCVLVVDADGRPRTWLDADHLQRLGERPLVTAGMSPTIVEPWTTLIDTLDEMLTARYSCAVVVDGDGRYQGVVHIDTINEAMRAIQEDERARLRGTLVADHEVATQP